VTWCGASWRSRGGVVAGEAGVLHLEGDADLQAQDLGLVAVDLVARGCQDRRVGGVERDEGLHHEGPRGQRGGHVGGELLGVRIALAEGLGDRDGERLADDGEHAGEGDGAGVGVAEGVLGVGEEPPRVGGVGAEGGGDEGAGAGLVPVGGLGGLEGEGGVEVAVERAGAQVGGFAEGCPFGQVAARSALPGVGDGPDGEGEAGDEGDGAEAGGPARGPADDLPALGQRAGEGAQRGGDAEELEAEVADAVDRQGERGRTGRSAGDGPWRPPLL
jgi:hypothetical protein